MNELIAKKVFKEVKEVLDINGVGFWLNFGGLLGAVREGEDLFLMIMILN